MVQMYSDNKKLVYQSKWLHIYDASFPIAGEFRISRGAKKHARVLIVEIFANGCRGRGECVPYARYQESIQSVSSQLIEFAEHFERNNTSTDIPTQAQIQIGLTAGAARNALDCAWWDLQCKCKQLNIWQLLELRFQLSMQPKPLTSAYTLSLDTPDKMAIAAKMNAHRPLLKLKLAGQGDIARVEAVRDAAPMSQLIVDANEGWDRDMYLEMVPILQQLKVSLIEQPFPSNQDVWLDGLPRPIPICADESCHDSQSLAKLVGRFDVVNIKLDKTGGLTEAFMLKDQAISMGFELMVGCMVGSSLSMAPAFVIAQNVGIVDLDGPLLLSQDCEHGFEFNGSQMLPFSSDLWG